MIKLEYENDRLVVDELIYCPGSLNLIARIGTEHYMINTHYSRPYTEQNLRPYKPEPSKDWPRVTNSSFLFHGMVPRKGFDVKIGRPITEKEFEALIEEYELQSGDISKEFIETRGAVYGKKHEKSYTATQIRVSDLCALDLKQKLRNQGIEANNGNIGVVSIRTEWGGAREGAGRPSTGRKKHQYYVTEEEDAAIKNLIEDMRK